MEEFQAKYGAIQAQQAEVLAQLDRLRNPAAGGAGPPAGANGARNMAREFALQLGGPTSGGPPGPRGDPRRFDDSPPRRLDGGGGGSGMRLDLDRVRSADRSGSGRDRYDRREEAADYRPTRYDGPSESASAGGGRRNGIPSYWGDRSPGAPASAPPPTSARRYDGGMERTVYMPPERRQEDRPSERDRYDEPPRRGYQDRSPPREREANDRYGREYDGQRSAPQARDYERGRGRSPPPRRDEKRHGYEIDQQRESDEYRSPPGPSTAAPPTPAAAVVVSPVAPPSFPRPAHKSWTSPSGAFASAAEAQRARLEKERKQEEHKRALMEQIEEKERIKAKEKADRDALIAQERQELADAQDQEKKALQDMVHQVQVGQDHENQEERVREKWTEREDERERERHHRGPTSRRGSQADFTVHHASDSGGNSPAASPEQWQRRGGGGGGGGGDRYRDRDYDQREEARVSQRAYDDRRSYDDRREDDRGSSNRGDDRRSRSYRSSEPPRGGGERGRARDPDRDRERGEPDRRRRGYDDEDRYEDDRGRNPRSYQRDTHRSGSGRTYDESNGGAAAGGGGGGVGSGSPLSDALDTLAHSSHPLSPSSGAAIVPLLRGLNERSHLALGAGGMAPQSDLIGTTRIAVSNALLKTDQHAQARAFHERKLREEEEEKETERRENERIARDQAELAEQYAAEIAREHGLEPPVASDEGLQDHREERERQVRERANPALMRRKEQEWDQRIRATYGPSNNGGGGGGSTRAHAGRPSSSSRRHRDTDSPPGDYDPLNYSQSPERRSPEEYTPPPAAARPSASQYRRRPPHDLSESTIGLLHLEAEAAHRVAELSRLERERDRQWNQRPSGSPGASEATFRGDFDRYSSSGPRGAGAMLSPTSSSSSGGARGASSSSSFDLLPRSRSIPSVPQGGGGSGFASRPPSSATQYHPRASESSSRLMEQSLRGSSDWDPLDDATSLDMTIRRGLGRVPGPSTLPVVHAHDDGPAGGEFDSHSRQFADLAVGDLPPPEHAGILDVKSVFIAPDGSTSVEPRPFDDADLPPGVDVNASSRNAPRVGGYMQSEQIDGGGGGGSSGARMPSMLSPTHRPPTASLFSATFALPSSTSLPSGGGGHASSSSHHHGGSRAAHASPRHMFPSSLDSPPASSSSPSASPDRLRLASRSSSAVPLSPGHSDIAAALAEATKTGAALRSPPRTPQRGGSMRGGPASPAQQRNASVGEEYSQSFVDGSVQLESPSSSRRPASAATPATPRTRVQPTNTQAPPSF